MIAGLRSKDFVVLAALVWWLLRDKESTQVQLTQTCIDGDGNLYRVPLGDCPPGTTLDIIETPPIGDPEQLGCGGCGGRCGGCA